MLKITSKQLKDLGACESGLKEFEEAFPDGFVARSLEEAKRKVLSAAHLDYYWAMDRLLGEGVEGACEEAMKHILEKYKKATKAASTVFVAAHGKAKAATQKKSGEALAIAWDARTKAIASAERIYNEESMITFISLYWGQEHVRN